MNVRVCVRVCVRTGHPPREFQQRDREVKQSRLTSEELQKLQEEQARKREEERKAREGKTKRKVEIRPNPLEEVWHIITS